MIYLFIYLLLYPLLFILNFFRPKPEGNLILQTAKIGDYANTTVMFELLKKSDVILDHTNVPFAKHDSRINRYYVANDHKKGLFKKLKFGFLLFWNNYENVYVIMPNALNLFWANMAFSDHTATLTTYSSKSYIRWLAFLMRTISHFKEDLTIDSYLKLINPAKTHKDVWKKITEPLYIPPLPKIETSNRFKVGISIAAGNKIKTIEKETWEKLFGILKDMECNIYLFGLKDEETYLENLDTTGLNIISLLGRIPLEELPWHIAQMNLYISSDTGNSYIADSFHIPLINFAGPCYMKEQRPIGENVLIVKSNAPCAPFSYIFKAPYAKSCEGLYLITDSQEKAIQTFIQKQYQTYHSSLK